MSMMVQSGRFATGDAGSAYSSAVVSLSASTSTNPVPWDVTSYENLGEFHNPVTNNSRVVAPVTGLYRFILSADVSSSAIRYMNKNGAVVPLGSAGLNGSSPSQSPSAIIPMTAGDYMQIDNGGIINLGGLTWFSAEHIADGTLYSLVGRTSGLALAGATFAFVPWQEPAGSVNTGGFFNSANPTRLTVTAGTKPIRLTAGVTLTSFTGKLTVYVIKNGGTLVWKHEVEHTGEHVLSIMTPAFDRVPGDYYEFAVNPQVACTLSADGRSFFSMEEVPDTTKRCMVRLTSNKALGTSYGALTFDAAVHNPDGMFNPATPTIVTVPSGCTEARALYQIAGTSTAGGNILEAVVTGLSGYGLCGGWLNSTNDDTMAAVGPWVPVTPGTTVQLQAKSSAANNASNETRFALECR